MPDPVLEALKRAPYDDEVVTLDESHDVERARQELAESGGLTTEEVRDQLSRDAKRTRQDGH